MNKLYIGARVRITHINSCITNGSVDCVVIARSSIGSWHTSIGYYIDIEGKTILGAEGIIGTVELLNPVKRYKYRYKR